MCSEDTNNYTDVLKLFEKKKLVKICSPMVRYSKLQFRSLVREYGCDLCYTPMILADSFCLSDKARRNEFTTNKNDSPLIMQFASNTVHDFVGAAYMASPYCNGVDLNCGCPQRWAKQMGIGSALLNNPDLIYDMIRQCRNRISKPFTVSVKLRLLKDIRNTVELCKRIEKTGASFISVHARNTSQLTGDINVEALKLIVENVQCPVVANGGVKRLTDCFELQEKTNCKGIMVANGLLTNPTLFSGTELTTKQCIQKWLNICYNSTLNEYPSLTSISDNSLNLITEKPPNLTFQCFHHHLVFMLEKLLPKRKKRIFNNLQTFRDVLYFLHEEFNIAPQLYNVETFNTSKTFNLDYNDRDEVYHDLKMCAKNNLVLSNGYTEYNYENTDGKFFKSKVCDDISPIECDLNSIFL